MIKGDIFILSLLLRSRVPKITLPLICSSFTSISVHYIRVSVYREVEAQNTAPMFITVYVSSNWPLLLVDNITNQGSHQKQK
jgi:hypothetical protein